MNKSIRSETEKRAFYSSKRILPGETEIRVTRVKVEPCVVYLHPLLLLLYWCMGAVVRVIRKRLIKSLKVLCLMCAHVQMKEMV